MGTKCFVTWLLVTKCQMTICLVCVDNTDLSLELGAFLCFDVKWLNKGEE